MTELISFSPKHRIGTIFNYGLCCLIPIALTIANDSLYHIFIYFIISLLLMTVWNESFHRFVVRETQSENRQT